VTFDAWILTGDGRAATGPDDTRYRPPAPRFRDIMRVVELDERPGVPKLNTHVVCLYEVTAKHFRHKETTQ
jgi:hypothetical protein